MVDNESGKQVLYIQSFFAHLLSQCSKSWQLANEYEKQGLENSYDIVSNKILTQTYYRLKIIRQWLKYQWIILSK